MRTIERLIRRAWWRLVLTDALRTSALTLAAAGVVLFAWRVLSSVVPMPAEAAGGWGAMLGAGAGLAVVAALAWSVLRVKRGEAVARRVDERAGLRESLSTAMAVGGLDDAWSRAAVSQAERLAAGVDLGRALPIESPRAWPAPVAAWGVLGLALALPAPDLQGLFGAPAAPAAAREVIEARAEADETTRTLKEQAERLGMQLDFDEDEPGEEVGAPDTQTPEQIRAAAVKKLTKLGDELAQKMETPEQATREAIEDRLQRLRQPGPGPAEELSRALARGEFGKAKEALDELQKRLGEGDLTEAQREQLEQQLENLAQQLQELGERRDELEKALREAGMSPDEAKRLAADPEALKRALADAANLTEAQKQQLQKLAESARQSQGVCQGMSSAMSQMASAMQGTPMNAAMLESMGELSGQLSQLEMLAADMASMQAMMQQVRSASLSMGACSNPGAGSVAGDRWGLGGRSAGSAGGVDTDSADGGKRFSSQAARAPVKLRDGPIIGSSLVYESQVRGESRAVFAEAAQSASASASDAIESMRVPRAYEQAVQRYFGALEREAERGSSESEAGSGATEGE